jgi:beta-galactosidase beta subunit
MTKKILKSKHADDLRRRAEKRIPETLENIKGMSAAEIQKLVHELHVHQIELEMQNEALQKSQTETEEKHRKYTDLYEKKVFAGLKSDQILLQGCVRVEVGVD